MSKKIVEIMLLKIVPTLKNLKVSGIKFFGVPRCRQYGFKSLPQQSNL